jgi:predicted dehydrogenase
MVNIGVLGSGAVLQWHLFGIGGNENINLKAIASRNEATGKAACEKTGATYYKSPQDLFENEDNLDGIINLMPNHLHFDTCNAAIDAGFRHILCEKPLGNDVAQTQTLVDKVKATGTQLQVAYMKRFNPGFSSIKKNLYKFGEIGFVNFTTVETGSADAISHRDASSPWKIAPLLSGGGNLTHVGSHIIDLARYFFGDVRSGACKLRRDQENAPEYYANARLAMDHGIDVDVRIGRVDIPNLGADWEIFQGGWNEYVEVIGSKGYMRVSNPSWEGLQAVKVTSWFNGESGPTTTYFESNLQWVNEIANFAQSCETGRLGSDATTAEDAYKVDYIVSKLRESDVLGGLSVDIVY